MAFVITRVVKNCIYLEACCSILSALKVSSFCRETADDIKDVIAKR